MTSTDNLARKPQTKTNKTAAPWKAEIKETFKQLFLQQEDSQMIFRTIRSRGDWLPLSPGGFNDLSSSADTRYNAISKVNPGNPKD